jgi:hypothetical protein
MVEVHNRAAVLGHRLVLGNPGADYMKEAEHKEMACRIEAGGSIEELVERKAEELVERKAEELVERKAVVLVHSTD